MTQLDIELLTGEEYSYYLAYGELPLDEDIVYVSEAQVQSQANFEREAIRLGLERLQKNPYNVETKDTAASISQTASRQQVDST